MQDTGSSEQCIKSRLPGAGSRVEGYRVQEVYGAGVGCKDLAPRVQGARSRKQATWHKVHTGNRMQCMRNTESRVQDAECKVMMYGTYRRVQGVQCA